MLQATVWGNSENCKTDCAKKNAWRAAHCVQLHKRTKNYRKQKTTGLVVASTSHPKYSHMIRTWPRTWQNDHALATHVQTTHTRLQWASHKTPKKTQCCVFATKQCWIILPQWRDDFAIDSTSTRHGWLVDSLNIIKGIVLIRLELYFAFYSSRQIWLVWQIIFCVEFFNRFSC